MLATLNLMREHGLMAADIERLTLVVGDDALRNCEPLLARWRPRSTADAKFSLPYTAAAAAVHGDVRLSDFDAERLTDPQVAVMADRIGFVYGSDYDIGYGMPPGAVRVFTKDGRSLLRRENLPCGHPAQPMPWDQLEAKVMECFGLAQDWLAPSTAREIIAIRRSLEGLHDVSQLTGRLRAPS